MLVEIKNEKRFLVAVCVLDHWFSFALHLTVLTLFIEINMKGAAGNAFAVLWLQLTLTLQGSSHNGNSGETPASAQAAAAMPHRKT